MAFAWIAWLATVFIAAWFCAGAVEPGNIHGIAEVPLKAAPAGDGKLARNIVVSERQAALKAARPLSLL